MDGAKEGGAGSADAGAAAAASPSPQAASSAAVTVPPLATGVAAAATATNAAGAGIAAAEKPKGKKGGVKVVAAPVLTPAEQAALFAAQEAERRALEQKQAVEDIPHQLMVKSRMLEGTQRQKPRNLCCSKMRSMCSAGISSRPAHSVCASASFLR
jgi:hypothetical protein